MRSSPTLQSARERARTLLPAVLFLGAFGLSTRSILEQQPSHPQPARSVSPGEHPRAIPAQGDAREERDLVEAQAEREWYLLTYPTGRMPAMAWNRARDWVKRNVQDAAPWQGLSLRSGGAGSNAVIPPGTNTWVSYGPKPLDSVGTTNEAYSWGLVSGRVASNGLAIDPVNPNVAYASFAAGGFWKTTNLGSTAVTWTPLWDDKDFVSQAAGAMDIDPSNHNVLYVGTGDAVGRAQFGAGIMKTTNGGTTWTQLGASVFTPFSPTLPPGGNRWDNQSVKALKVDPHNPSTVLVGTRSDLYITHDAGLSWEICGFGNNYTNPSVNGGPQGSINRISSIYLDARGPSTVAYVAVGHPTFTVNGDNGIYRFTIPLTGCPAWPSGFTTLFGGLPDGTGNGVNYADGGSITGRIELAGAVGQDGHLTLYAQVEEVENQGAEGTYVLRPDSGATTWTRLAGSSALDYLACNGNPNPTTQDFFDLFLAVNPSNDKDLYIGHIDAFRAEVDPTYTSIKLDDLTNAYDTDCPSYGKVHPDQHAFAFVPGSKGTAFLLGNDGGIYLNDKAGDFEAWKQLNNSFNTFLFYAGQIGTDFAGNGMNGVQWVLGGMQDNGNSSWDSTRPSLTGTARGIGGDGFFVAFDPLAGSETTGWWLTEYTFGSIVCSVNSGANGPFTPCEPVMTGTADFSAPFLLDTLHCTNTQCSNLIFGEDYVHASGSYGATAPNWVQISPLLTKGGGSASVVSLGWAPSKPTAAVAGTSDGKLWWSEDVYTGSQCTQFKANKAGFSCTPNPGAVWRDVDPTNTVLPNRAVLGVVADPSDHTRIYAAVGGFNPNTPSTPGHLFSFKWNGSSWTATNKTGNLPDVPANSVAVNPRNRKQVFVGTYFGFYYTNDIDASTVTWVRYQHGLPNVLMRYLTVDRGPATNPYRGTTLAAFTFGRGVYAIRLPSTGGLP
ncbi:MAG: hypothetical protein U0002_02120 [Thermoanaerobaculia bacterium]